MVFSSASAKVAAFKSTIANAPTVPTPATTPTAATTASVIAAMPTMPVDRRVRRGDPRSRGADRPDGARRQREGRQAGGCRAGRGRGASRRCQFSNTSSCNAASTRPRRGRRSQTRQVPGINSPARTRKNAREKHRRSRRRGLRRRVRRWPARGQRVHRSEYCRKHERGNVGSSPRRRNHRDAGRRAGATTVADRDGGGRRKRYDRPHSARPSRFVAQRDDRAGDQRTARSMAAHKSELVHTLTRDGLDVESLEIRATTVAAPVASRVRASVVGFVVAFAF